ncbi:hypothetical protein CTI12_AA537710 [Artemisia annua]|uniref:Uncharacterized protein n=1 Tax=Artemisia annua TaxID=35608 RepID=A0A2U1L2H4_ARTAN|nr:hypothetical protein CTI12_AA537710 [Artemisia annua]
MFKFLKEVVSGSGAGVKDLPYNIGEPYSSAWGSWTHSRGTSKLNSLTHPLSYQHQRALLACQSGHKIDLGLRILYIVSTVIFALNLVAVIVLTVVGIVKIRRALHILLMLCWLITVFCWLFFELYFFLSRFAGDTCTTLEGFQQNPYNNSLSSILPCGLAFSRKRP